MATPIGLATLLAALAGGALLAGAPPAQSTAAEKRFQEGAAALRGAGFSLSNAAKAFGEACEAGHMPACARLGLQVQDGRGVAYDPARAAELYKKVCDAGWGIGCFNLAGLHVTGNGVAEDRARVSELMQRAETLYAKACDAGDLQWCTNLGVLYEGQFLGDPDPAKALAVYRKACDRKAGDWCVNLALMQAYGEGTPKNVKAGAALLQKNCSAGVPLACGALGQMYANTKFGLPEKPAKGVPLLVKACDAGEVQACGVISALYAIGDGIPADAALAKRYGERACALGSSAACFAEAMSLVESRRFADALTWLERSCHIGNAEACAAAAAVAEGGPDAAANAPKAALFRRDACRLGDSASCLAVFQSGEKLPLGPERERAFFDEACRRNVPGSCR